MLQQAFDVLNLERVYLFVADYNARARNLYTTSGFKHEGTLRHHVALDGRYYDLLVMGLLRSEFADAASSRTAPE